MKQHPRLSPSAKGLALPCLLVLSAGAFIVVYKALLDWLAPFTALCLTLTGTAAVYLALNLRNGLGAFRVTRRQLLFLGVLGICGTALNGSLIWATELSPASQVSLLVRSDVVFSVLLGFFFFGERLSRSGLFGLLVMGAGAFLVLKIFPWQLRLASVGDLLALSAGFLLSTNAIIVKYYLAELPSELIICYNSCIMSVLSFLLVIATSSLSTFTPAASTVPLLLVGLAVLLSAAMFMAYYSSLAEHPVWAVRAFLLLSPFITMLLGLWLLDETVVWTQWGGGVMLFIGGLLLLKGLRGRTLLEEWELQK